ncbi:MAG: DsrE family protein [Steroidobacteraceae bacterium]
MSTQLSTQAILAGLLLAATAVASLGAAPVAAAHGIAPGTAAASPSSTGPATVWVFPVIEGYGGVHPRSDLPGVAPQVDYRVIADVTHGEKDPAQVSGGLQRLARLVNLFAYAGVPRSHVHIAAVIEGPAGFAAFSNAAYRKRFHVDNPNLTLLHRLRQSGVELMVCSQAMAENGFEDADISPDVRITLSALTDFAIYGARGYSYLQL